MEDTAAAWLERIAPSVNAAAGQIGMTTSTLSRQLASKDGLPAETAIRLARAYNESVVGTLVELGYISAEEASEGAAVMTSRAALAAATEAELLAEIGARLEGKSAGPRAGAIVVDVTDGTPVGPVQPSTGAHAVQTRRARRRP